METTSALSELITRLREDKLKHSENWQQLGETAGRADAIQFLSYHDFTIIDSNHERLMALPTLAAADIDRIIAGVKLEARIEPMKPDIDETQWLEGWLRSVQAVWEEVKGEL